MYLEKRRRQYYALHDIPADVQDKLPYGKRYFAPLKTDSLTIAKRRLPLLEARLRGEIDAARRGVKDPAAEDASFWRNQLKEARNEEERELILDFIRDEAHERLEKIARMNGDGDITHLPESPEVTRFYKQAVGELVNLTEHLDDWIATLASKPRTIAQAKSNIQKFAKGLPFVQDVTRKEVQKWANAQALEGGKRPGTITKHLSDLRVYWDYLISLEVVADENRPFDKIKVSRINKPTPEEERKPFTAQQVVDLLEEAENRGKDKLSDLIRLGMWTGARIEELCALKVEHVHHGWFEVADAKTDAGRRHVPIHTRLRPIIRRLADNSDDGYLLSGLAQNKYGDRSAAIGKAFGRLKSDLGFGEAHVFHSIRKTVITLLENAGVPENVTMDIVGHEKPSLTYGTYSGGNKIEVLCKALAKLSYPRH